MALCTLLVGFVPLAWATNAMAQGVYAEPWSITRTEHFRVYSHESVRAIADEVAALCEAAHAQLVPIFGEPGGVTHVVLTDAVDAANGSATVIPLRIMRLQAMPPESSSTLGYFDHWMWNLIVHEYTHILHLSQMNRLFAWANVPLGRRFAPNQQLPRWLIEGLATWQESVRTGTGRVNSPAFVAWLRQAVWTGSVPSTGSLNGAPTFWPQGNAWYLYGSFFVAWIAETRGPDAWVDFIQTYGRRLVPFGINVVARETLGADIPTLWAEWQAAQAGRFLAEHTRLRIEGLDEPERVTTGGYQHRYVTATADGRCVSWLRDDGVHQVAIQTECLQGGGPPEALRDGSAHWRTVEAPWDDHQPLPTELVENDGEYDFAPDGRSVIISQTLTWRNGFAFRDLFRFDFETLDWTRLTDGERAREPRISPDGRTVVYVRPAEGRTDLWRLDLASGERTLVAEAEPWGQYARPAFVPDGSAIVVSYLEPGWGRDLVEISLADGAQRRLTHDPAFDLDPWVVGDDVYFSSDRSGIFDIYRVRRSDGHMVRVTRTWGGMHSPVVVDGPDGRWLYASGYSALGYDVVRLRLDELRSSAGVGPVPPGPDPRDVAVELPEVPPARRYLSGFGVRPFSWMPGVTAAAGDTLVGVTVLGGDPVGIHTLSGSLQWSVPSARPVWAFQATTAAFPVGLSLSTSRRFIERPESVALRGERLASTTRETVVSVGTSFPIPIFASGHSLSASWTWQRFRPVDLPRVELRPEDPVPRYPEAFRYDSLGLGWSWRDTVSTVQGISTQRGTSLSAGYRIRTQRWSSDADTGELNWGAEQFVPMPWAWRHVLALRLNGGMARTRGVGRRLYGVGGIPPQDAVTALIDQLPAGNVHVRGYPVNVRVGDQYYLATMEYRFPLVDLNFGYATFPWFLQRLHGAVFVDVGNAWDGRLRVGDALVSTGAEVRLWGTLGYFEGVSFRAGAARGLTGPGTWNVYLLYGWSY